MNQSYDQDSGFKPGGTGNEFDDEPPLLEGSMWNILNNTVFD